MPTEEEMREQLKNMSPEQIAELQKQQCIFCKMISGEVPSKKVYEDDKFIAVLDINPGSPGHMLVMSKEHYSIMPQMPDDLISHLGMLAKNLSQAALRGLQAKGTTIFVANGAAAGQRASHFLLHILPRTDDDNVGIKIPEGSLSEEDMKKLQAALQPSIDKLLPKPVVKEETKEKSKEETKELPEKKETQEEVKEKDAEEEEKEETEEETEEDEDREKESDEEDNGEDEDEEVEEDSDDDEESKEEEDKDSEEESDEEEEVEETKVEEKEDLSDLDKITDFLAGGGGQ